MDKKQLIANNWKSMWFYFFSKTDLAEAVAPEWIADDTLSSPNACYLVLTREEADELAAEYVADSLWAFQPRFLSKETGLPLVVFEAIQGNGQCEDNNGAISSIVAAACGIDHLIKRAIEEDGRGHFLSGYDGEEHKVEVGGETLYFYRVN